MWLEDLPIPESIYGECHRLHAQNTLLTCLVAINNTRKTALSTILATLKRRREYLENNDQPACCADCDSLYLGTLIRLMKPYNLDSEPPYLCLCVDRIAELVLNFRQLPNIHVSKPGPVAFGKSSQSNSKLLGEGTKQEVEKAISVLQGLELS